MLNMPGLSKKGGLSWIAGKDSDSYLWQFSIQWLQNKVDTILASSYFRTNCQLTTELSGDMKSKMKDSTDDNN